MNSNRCGSCIYFVSHDSYEYIGYCIEKEELSLKDNEKCHLHKKINREKLIEIIETKGWIYCRTCRKPIFSVDELDKHLNDKLVSKYFPDEVAAEESPAGD